MMFFIFSAVFARQAFVKDEPFPPFSTKASSPLSSTVNGSCKFSSMVDKDDRLSLFCQERASDNHSCNDTARHLVDTVTDYELLVFE